MELHEFWRRHPAAAVAFSGGVDSAYLLWSAAEAGADAAAYFVRTEFQPEFELEDARATARALGLPLTVVALPVLDDPQIAANPPDRCYHCKRRMFEALREAAARDGRTLLLDGTNASDDGGGRPGMRALEELGVLSPLRLCGLDKAEIRRRARAAGLAVWDKPAYACLATRFPAGMALTAEALAAVEAAEGALFSLGFTDFRVRRTAAGAKLQLPAAQLPAAAARHGEILAALEPLVGETVLDLRPRAGEDAAADGLIADRVTELRCNLDDMTGEDIAFAVSLLLEQGALDAWTAPIYMKKGRPAVLLSCLCRPAEAARFTDLLLRHTTTLGVRRSDADRLCLPRTAAVRGGVRVKTAAAGDIQKEKAEFDDLAALSRQTGLPLETLRRRRGL